MTATLTLLSELFLTERNKVVNNAAPFLGPVKTYITELFTKIPVS